MAWAQNKIAVYEQMIVNIRRFAEQEALTFGTARIEFLSELNEVITLAEQEAAGAVPEGVATADDLARPAAKLIARWLWDRNLAVHDVAHTTDRAAEAAGAAGAAPQAWTIAAHLMAKMETRAITNPNLPALARHHLNDRAQWAGLPATAPKAAKTTEAPADPFRHGSSAEANRLAKAKQLARWLWDRNIDADMLLAFTDKYRREIARAAGVNPPSSLTTWNAACGLITKMEIREAADPTAKVVVRNHLGEHDQWAADPNAAKV